MNEKKHIQFTVKNEFIKLSDLLKVTGICMTGGEAGMLIQDGKVFRNGEVELRKRAKIKENETISTDEFVINT